MENSEIITLISLLSSIASLILSVFAIWLAFMFFRMSSTLNEKSADAAKQVSAGVEKLEKLFDNLYNDTFAIMRDTVTDMRKHMWSGENLISEHIVEEADKKAQEKISLLKNETTGEFSKILIGQNLADDVIHNLESKMEELLEKAISGTRKAEVEAQTQTIQESKANILREFTMEMIKRSGGNEFAEKVINEVMRTYPTTESEISAVMKAMRRDGQIAYEGELTPSTSVTLGE